MPFYYIVSPFLEEIAQKKTEYDCTSYSSMHITFYYLFQAK